MRQTTIHAVSMLILLLAAAGNLPAALAKPVALLMCAVADYSSDKRFDATAALRFQIVSKLVQDYDCLMLSRSMSDCLTFEQEIRQLEILQSGKAGQNTILAAD